MRIDIVTLLPALFDKVFDESILGSARKSGVIDIRVRDLRPYGEGRHRMVDDTAFGGGPGMVLKPGPLAACLRSLRGEGPAAPTVALTPQGIPFDQDLARELSRLPRLILVCGRYEGFDERLGPEFDVQLSVGDYVMTGGEFAAMTVVDAVSRMIPGTVGRQESVEQDSFYDGFLDHPQYTRPPTWEDHTVPDCLLGGHHARIQAWRRGRSLIATAMHRPDLLSRRPIAAQDAVYFQESLAEGHVLRFSDPLATEGERTGQLTPSTRRTS